MLLLRIGEQTDLPQFLADQLVEGIPQQVDHERIRIHDLSARFFEDEDRILGGLEEPPVARLGLSKSMRGHRALGDVADVALDHGLAIDHVRVADELHVDAFALLGLERDVFVADVAFALQLLHRGLALGLVGEETDLPELFPDQFVERVAEQVDDERIRVHDRPRPFFRIEDEDRVLRGLEESAVTRLGRFQGGLLRGLPCHC